MQKQVMPLESLIKLLKPGRCMFVYGGEEHGFPMKPLFVQVVSQHLDKREVENERINVEKIPDPEKREAALKFFAEPGLKMFAQVTPEDYVSTHQIELHLKELKKSRELYPDFVKRYLELRQLTDIPLFVDSESTPHEVELYQLHDFLSKIPKELLVKYLKSDEDRYTELQSKGVLLRTRNADCQTDLELELLKLSRKVTKKH